jgi:dienelactone hydrolase
LTHEPSRGSGAFSAGGTTTHLALRHVPPAPQAAVLLLHGGRADALTPPPRLNLPSLRMRPFATAILRATRPRPVLVAEVRYRHRGWNGPRGDAARDARHALRELRSLAGPLPVVLVGHSMGGRAALCAADEPQVQGVVALAPWCPPGEPVTHLAGRTVVVLHDEHDRVTQAGASWEFVRRARGAGARAGGITMAQGGHAMLRAAPAWHRLAAAATAAILGYSAPPAEFCRALSDHE